MTLPKDGKRVNGGLESRIGGYKLGNNSTILREGVTQNLGMNLLELFGGNGSVD